MSGSTTRFDQPVTHSPLRAWLRSWAAVHDGTPLDAHLRSCLCRYQAKGRQSFHPLPWDTAVVHGHILCTPNPEYMRYWERLRDDSAGEGGVQFLTALEMQVIARDEGQLEVEDQELTHRMREVVEAIEQQEAQEVEAILRSQERGKRTRARHAGRCRRPRVPFPWLLAGGFAAVVLMSLVELFQLTWPFLDLLGVDTSNLSAEWARNPIAVAGGVLSALAATACLIFPWHLIINTAVAITTSWERAGPLKTGVRLAGLFFLSVILLCGTVAIANLRHSTVGEIIAFQDAQQGQHADTRVGTSVFIFLTFLVPAASAYLQHKIGQSAYWQRRRAIQAQQAQWNRAEDEQLCAVERRADAMELLQRKRAQIEEQQARHRAKRLALAGRVLAAQRDWLEMLDHARFATETYARTLLSALEQDNIHFLRAAHRCQALYLVPEEARGHSQAGATPHRQFVRPLLTDSRNGHGS